MAAKPMPRLRAGISGSPLITSPKRSLALHVKSKSLDNRNSNRHSSATSGSLRREPTLQMKKLDIQDDAFSSSEMSKLSENPPDELPNSTDCKSTWNRLCKQIEINAKSPELESIAQIFDQTTSSRSEQQSQIIHLKQLMHLQISLIGRQQELLKQRDKEVLQLKTKTQSYKNRLERMERRIMLLRRKSDNSTTTVKYGKNMKQHDTNLNNQVNIKQSDLDHDSSVCPTDSTLDCSNMPSASCSSYKSYVQVSDKLYKLPNQPIKTRSVSTNTPIPFNFVSCLTSSSTTDDCFTSTFLKNPLQSDQYLLKNSNPTSQTLVINACDNCSTCTNIAKRFRSDSSVAGTAHAVSSTITEEASKPQLPALQNHPKTTDEDISVERTCKNEVALEANHPYHLITWPREDQSYPYTDLDFSFEEGSTLNIPTWKINKLPGLTGTVQTQIKENTDDEAYYKRHSRLEIGEKRRKRWDFQRIREYRYNEKLRQKHLKQSRDQYSFDTFSPSLSDINALQVQDNLPLNIFGHSLEHLQKEEFSFHSDM